MELEFVVYEKYVRVADNGSSFSNRYDLYVGDDNNDASLAFAAKFEILIAQRWDSYYWHVLGKAITFKRKESDGEIAVTLRQTHRPIP